MSTTGITFNVPLPPRELSPNGRHHWSKKNRAVGVYREEVGWRAKAMKSTGVPDVAMRVSLRFCLKGGRREHRYQPTDCDNALASFKAGLDGMRDAKLLVADTNKWLQLGTVEITSKTGPWVEVTVEPMKKEPS